MATADELGRSAWDEVHRLREVWAELYTPDGPDGELSNGRLSEDMDHSPVGLRHFVSALVGETCSTINAVMNQMIEDGNLEPGGAAFDFAMNSFAAMMRMVCCRMYEIGQHVHDELPYHALVPCACKSLVDDEFEQLLSEPYNLEGDGFLIKDFDTTKATKMKGKAYWL